MITTTIEFDVEPGTESNAPLADRGRGSFGGDCYWRAISVSSLPFQACTNFSVLQPGIADQKCRFSWAFRTTRYRRRFQEPSGLCSLAHDALRFCSLA